MKGRLYGDDAEREQFYYAVTIVCDAAIILSKRYAAECRRQAAECAGLRGTPPGRESSCCEMAEGLDWIMENPARSFRGGRPVPVSSTRSSSPSTATCTVSPSAASTST